MANATRCDGVITRWRAMASVSFQVSPRWEGTSASGLTTVAMIASASDASDLRRPLGSDRRRVPIGYGVCVKASPDHRRPPGLLPVVFVVMVLFAGVSGAGIGLIVRGQQVGLLFAPRRSHS
jgi:hypothetical protein